MNFSSTLLLVSMLVPGKGWYAPEQPLEVTVRASGEYALALTDFTGRNLDPEGSADVAGDKTVDARKIFPQLATPGTYVLSALPRGQARKNFIGTPLVIGVRADTRRGAPPGPMVVKLEPLC